LSIIIQKAHELGHALSESAEAAILHAAEMDLEQDKEAQVLISDFQERHKSIQDAEQSDKEVSDEEWDVLNQAQEKMKENKTVRAYMAAMQNLQKLLQDANEEVNKALNGGSSCSTSECDGCSCDCCQ
jgi:cell fate (sporulation/competence/biofilm development) regulator YlbF (YheA/YmcA/DUF963 family)